MKTTEYNPTSILESLYRKYIFFLPFILSSIASYATHNRAGEIIYTHLYGNTYKVEVITYTYSKSQANHNRDELTLEWGDGTVSQISRVQQATLPDDYLKNVYHAQHTYPGAGVYEIKMLDYNRNEGIENIFDSVNIPFAISTTLHINPMIGDNSTPQLLNPPFDKAVKGAVFIHNPAAHDPDGDSLSYALTVCAGEGGEPIEGYTYPAASNRFYINDETGDLVWDSPTAVGKYNVALVVKEWRNGQKIGEIVRDIQIEVIESDNKIPELPDLPDVCVYEGDTVRFNVKATDPDGDPITLEAVGGPFLLDGQMPSFAKKTGSGTVQSTFEWVTSCDHVRMQPYMVVFKASNHFENVTLADMCEVEIKVLPRPPVITSAVPSFNSVTIEWENSYCEKLKTFELYRSEKPENLPFGDCMSGMPANTSYAKIAELSANDTSFVDVDRGNQLQGGMTYCYRLVAVFTDDFQSFPSEELCVEVLKGLPKFTKVSVKETSSASGQIELSWTKAVLDDELYPGPYKYVLKRKEHGSNDSFHVVHSSTRLTDTAYLDQNVDTESIQWEYAVETYYTVNNSLKSLGLSVTASSLFLSLNPFDYALQASIAEFVPWDNYSFVIFNSDNDSLEEFSYMPGMITGLNNGQEYCLRAKVYGRYVDDSPRLINYSQVACGVPMDTVPPDPLAFTLRQQCDSMQNVLSWVVGVANDINRIEVYFAECENGDYELVADLPGAAESFIHDFRGSPGSMSGCYFVTVADAAGNKSKPHGPACVYSCEKYRLPNVFTPNNDGANDMFEPISDYKHVEKVDMQIFSSWGTLVYKTTDPAIKWNGISYENWEPVPDGVYYYVCDVYQMWHSCEIEPHTVYGFIQIISGVEPGKKVIINE